MSGGLNYRVSLAADGFPRSHYKFFKVTVLFSFCCLLFTAGFAMRIYGSYHYDDLNPFIASVCVIYAAP